jgi:ATP-dependent Lon protease
MPKDSDKSKKMLSKKQNGVSDSESESDYSHIEDMTREHMDLSPKEINDMILDLFPLKTKKERLKQLEKITQFKRQEKEKKIKEAHKKSKSKKGKLPGLGYDSDREDRKSSKLRRSFEKLKKGKYENKVLSKVKSKSKRGIKSCLNKKKPTAKRKAVAKKKNKSDSEEETEEESETEWDEEEEEEESGSEWETASSTDEDDSDSEYFPENEDEELDDDELDMLKDGNMKFNIIFTTGNGDGGEEDGFGQMMGSSMSFGDFMKNGDEYGDEYDDIEEYITSDDSEEDDDDSDKAGNSKEKKNSKNKSKNDTKFKKDETVMVKMKDWDGFYKGKVTKVNRYKNHSSKKMEVTYDIRLNNKDYDDVLEVPSTRMKSVNKETHEYEELIDEMKKLSKTKKKGKKAFDKKIETMMKALEKKNEKDKKREDKKMKSKNLSRFKTLLKTSTPVNDYKYFSGLKPEQQKLVLKKMKDLSEYDKVETPYRLQLIESDIPVEYKSSAIKKINSLNHMDPGSGEYYKIKQWVDTFMKIPFNITRSLPIKMDDGPEKCKKFMLEAKESLDGAVYGLDDAKMQIMQIVGQWISNPDSVGNAIAIQGPMGTGKTTLVKEGISKILNRPFAFLALGGATDSSFLEGHSYTYEGSSWGKIVDILLNSKCMNPVIYFDELDKISNTPKGEEIAGILTHLTDLTQNSQFHDKYFSSIDFDLSKVLFIFSYNDESKVNKILLDRMYKIRTKGYNNKEKITIANNYLIPSIIKNVNFKKEDIVFPEETLTHIISNYTEGEKGVRNLKRALEIIYTKLNLYRLMDEDTQLFDNEKSFKVTFPHTVTVPNVNHLIKKNDSLNAPPFGMYL